MQNNSENNNSDENQKTSNLDFVSEDQVNDSQKLDKDVELGCFEILKNNFPNLNGGAVVVGIEEFLLPETNLADYICVGITPKEAALTYIQAQKPYIVLDETEGYKCLFVRGNFIKVQYDITNSKIIRYVEEV